VSVPPEVLKKVKLLEIHTRKLVNNLFAGEYHTAFKGQGMTFADFREYVPGDDIRTISWPLTARTGKTFIKKFEEERELTMILAVDISGSTDFGSGVYFKGEVMTHIAALLALSAVKNNDQVGLLLFSDQVEHFVPPKKGRGHIHRLLRDLYYFKPRSSRTKIDVVTQYLRGVLKKKASIFILSDFMDEGYERSLKFLGRKHDVVACVIKDPMEAEIFNLGLVACADPETGEVLTFDTSSPEFRKEFHIESKRQNERRDRILKLAQIDRVDISNSENYASPLITYFRQRRK
jgi:uncharacterized protein (DUF58 family)